MEADLGKQTDKGGRAGRQRAWGFLSRLVPVSGAQSVNEALESMESPLELVEGFVGSIEVAVPWAKLLTDHCTILVSGLQLTLQPRHGPGEAGQAGRGGRTSGGRGPGPWS